MLEMELGMVKEEESTQSRDPPGNHNRTRNPTSWNDPRPPSSLSTLFRSTTTTNLDIRSCTSLPAVGVEKSSKLQELQIYGEPNAT